MTLPPEAVVAGGTVRCDACGGILELPRRRALATGWWGLRWRETQRGEAWRMEAGPERIWALPVLAIAVTWNAMVAWFWAGSLHVQWKLQAMSALIALPFLAAGALLGHFALRLLFGRARIDFDSAQLHLTEKPFVLRTMTEATPNIESFGTLDLGSEHLKRTAVTMRTRDGRTIELVLPVRVRADAEFIAERLNKALLAIRSPRGYRS